MSYTRVNWVDGSGGGTPISHDNLNIMDAGVSTLDSTVNATTGADTATMPSSDGPFTFINWLKYFMTQLKAITGGAHWYTAPTTTISALSTGKAALSGATFTGTITNTNAAAIANTASDAGIEHGSPTASNTPFIDFHSSGTNNDHDVRIIASGGTSTNGTGTLDVTAAGLTFNTKQVLFAQAGLTGKFSAQSTAPSSPADGDLWLDTSTVLS